MNSYSLKHWLIYVLISGISLSIPFFLSDGTLFEGLSLIIQNPGVLITDYLSVGGLYPTLFNVLALLVINIGILMVIKQPFNGPVIAGLLTIAGFAFFGKSIINFIPIYLGIFIYTVWMKEPLNQHSVVMLFSSAIGPLVSFLWFGIEGPLYLRLILGTLAGVSAGLFTPVLSFQAQKFHQGLNLYNIGFTLGIIATFFSIWIRLIGLDIISQVPLSSTYSGPLWIINGILLTLLVGATLLSPKHSSTYQDLLKTSGVGEDFVALFGLKNTLLNMVFLSLLGFFIVLILGINLNGPLMAGLWTMIGFGAYGKHLKNSVPLIVGVLIGILLGINSIHQIGAVIAIFFVTALAPVTSRYGVVVGVMAGILHLALLPVAYQIQGGFDLYNNGFTAGFAAYFVILGMKGLEHFKILKPKKI